MTLQLVPLHERLDLVPHCISLLAEQWPSENYDRLQELELHCPNGPCSLVLVSTQDGDREEIISHCRIVPVKDDEETMYIERVVTWKAWRGKGFGRKMMEMLEAYCMKLGYTRLHLRANPTSRYPNLYLRLGYRFTDSRPVMMGCAMLGGIPVPTSVAYPGLEEFHIQYDGCEHLSRLSSSSSSCVIIPPGPDGADGNMVIPQSSSGNFKIPKLSIGGTKGNGTVEMDTTANDDVNVPSWSIDTAGHCHLYKVISVIT